jgi:hypothetical protein
VDLNACIERIFDHLANRNREEAELALQDARQWIRNGGSMDGGQYDRLRKANADIQALLVDQSIDLQPREFTNASK